MYAYINFHSISTYYLAHDYGIEPHRRGFGDLTGTLPVSCIGGSRRTRTAEPEGEHLQCSAIAAMRYSQICWPGRNRTCIRWLTVIRNNPYTTGQFGIRSFKEWRIAGKTLLLRLEESNLSGAYLPNQLMRPTLHRYRNVELPIGLEPITLGLFWPVCKPIYTISSYARRLPGISDVKPL